MGRGGNGEDKQRIDRYIKTSGLKENPQKIFDNTKTKKQRR